METTIKVCSKCGIEKSVSEFYKARQYSDGLTIACKLCCKAKNKVWRSLNPIKIKDKRIKWYAINVKMSDEYIYANAEKIKKCKKCKEDKDATEYSLDRSRRSGLNKICRVCSSARNKLFRKNNAEKIKARRAIYRKRVYYTPKGNLNSRMSAVIYLALRKNKAGYRWESIVGYTVEDLHKHLESKFLPGMTWDNMHLWQIDHIVPRSFFQFTSYNDWEFQYCWSLDNLQPLWGPDNIRKSNKITFSKAA